MLTVTPRVAIVTNWNSTAYHAGRLALQDQRQSWAVRVSRLGAGGIASLIYDFCLSVATLTTVGADPSLRCTCMLPGR